MSLQEMRSACAPSRKAVNEEALQLQETVTQIALSLTALDERARKHLEVLQTEAETRSQAVSRTCSQWERALGERLMECQEVMEGLKSLEKRLHWKRLTLIAMVAMGFLGGVMLLIASLSLPGVNSLMYRLILILGR